MLLYKSGQKFWIKKGIEWNNRKCFKDFLDMKNRIDKELVERQLITSRTRAQELIESGYVKCNDKIIYKCNY